MRLMAVEYHDDLNEVQGDPRPRRAARRARRRRAVRPARLVARPGRGMRRRSRCWRSRATASDRGDLPLRREAGELHELGNWYSFRVAPDRQPGRRRASALLSAIARDLAERTGRARPDQAARRGRCRAAGRGVPLRRLVRRHRRLRRQSHPAGRAGAATPNTSPAARASCAPRSSARRGRSRSELVRPFRRRRLGRLRGDLRRKAGSPSEGSPAFLRRFAERGRRCRPPALRPGAGTRASRSPRSSGRSRRHRLHPQARPHRGGQAALARHHAQRRAVRAGDRPRQGRDGRLRHRRRRLQARLDGRGPHRATGSSCFGPRDPRNWPRDRQGRTAATCSGRGAWLGRARLNRQAIRQADEPDDTDALLRKILTDVLGLKPGQAERSRPAPGCSAHLPELDSMAVAGLLTEMEDRLDIVIEDDEVDGEMLETYGIAARPSPRRSAPDA